MRPYPGLPIDMRVILWVGAFPICGFGAGFLFAFFSGAFTAAFVALALCAGFVAVSLLAVAVGYLRIIAQSCYAPTWSETRAQVAQELTTPHAQAPQR